MVTYNFDCTVVVKINESGCEFERVYHSPSTGSLIDTFQHTQI